MNLIGVFFIFTTFITISVANYGHQEKYGPAHYEFDYSVHDPHTHDIKQQHEVRDGHVVKGSYSLHEPDGTKRVVEYVADPHKSFNAVVKRIGHAHHPQHYHHHGGAGFGSGGAGFGGAYSTVGVTHFGYKY